MTVELFTGANQATTIVTSGGTTSPSPGTIENWTVASSTPFPAASPTSSPPGQFHVTDAAPALASEIIAVTSVSGTTWTVVRGVEGSTPVAHAAGFTVVQVVTAGFLSRLPAGPGGSAVTYLPPPSGSDDTAVIAAALAALPTTTLYANPNNQSGSSATVHFGSIILGSGTYQFGASGDIGNLGPLVNVLGPGRNASMLAYYGAGDALRVFNPVKPSDDTFDDLAAFHGIIDGFTIDGTNASAGACGLHYGDTEGGVLGPDLMIQNFSQGQLGSVPTLTLGTTSGSGGTFGPGTFFWTVTAVNASGETIGSNQVHATLVAGGTQALSWTAVTGATGYQVYRGSGTAGVANTYVAAVAGTSYTDTGTSVHTGWPPTVNTTGNIGLHLDNTVSWTENIYGRVIIRNCANAVVFDVTTGDASFEYNDLTFKIYGMAAQNGVVVRNGASYANGSMKVRANFANSSAAMSSAALVLVGSGANGASQIATGRLDCQAEINTPQTGGGSNAPQTIAFSDPTHNVIGGCTGTLSFTAFAVPWVKSNYNQSAFGNNFIFDGVVKGDTNLSGASASNPTSIGARVVAAGVAQSGGFMPLASGDAFALTLSASTTLQFASASAPCIGGPQRKTITITQAASGGPYTVTWPAPGSPSLANPAVAWPGGAAPVMSAPAGAVDVYVLTTIDGVHWYGSAQQAISQVTRPNLYNPTGLRRWRAALGDSLFSQIPIVCVGDSITAGQGGDNNLTVFSNIPDNANGWAGQLRALLAAKLGTYPGEGFWFADDSRVTTTASNNNWPCVPLRHGPRMLHGDGHTIAVTIPAGITSCGIIQANQTQAFNAAGSNLADVSALYSQTGSATVTNAAITTLTNTGLPVETDIACQPGDTITVSSPATAQSYIVGFSMKTAANGVLVHRIGQPGYVSGDILGGQSSGTLLQSASASNQQSAERACYYWAGTTGMVIVSFGTNDQAFQAGGGTAAQNDVTLALYTAWMEQFIAQVVADGWCCLVLAEPRNPNGSGTGSTQDQYYAAMQSYALATDHVAYIDIGELWGSNAAATALGLAASNSVHPNRRGHGDIARMLCNALTGTAGITEPVAA